LENKESENTGSQNPKLNFQQMNKDKQRKLEHYADRPLTKFTQFDGFANVIPDYVMRPDEDGDTTFSGHTEELMTGGCAVRILVTEGTSQETAVRLIKKLLNWIESDANSLNPPEFKANTDELIEPKDIPF